MKRILSFLVIFTLIFSVTACSSKNELSDEEEVLYEALLVASDSFFNPSEMRILGVGDSQYVDLGTSMYKCVKVRIQGENKTGGVINDYYLLYLHTIEGKALATQIAEAAIYEDWENSEYLQTEYPSYDEYKERHVDYLLRNNFFHSVTERTRAAELDAKDSWDNAETGEYPRTAYKTYNEYLDFLYGYYERDYYVVKDYDKEIPAKKDANFGKCVILEDSYILTSEENIYDISKVNKALHDYWDKRLGNAD